MPIIFNWIGVAMVAISFLLGGIIYLIAACVFKSETTRAVIFKFFSASVAVAIDLGYRMKLGGGHIFLPDAGGNIFFIPIWICGIIFAIFYR